MSLGSFFKIKYALLESIIVGLMHFGLTGLGSFIGSKFISTLNINISLLSSVIFLYIALCMIKEYKNKTSKFKLSTINMVILAISVSLDSFGVGLILDPDLLNFSIISLFSFGFTIIGFYLGKYLSKKYENISKMLGIILMFGLSFVNIVNFILF